MPKNNYLSNAILNLIFRATAIANIADNAASSPLTNLYWALHTADPTVSGVQNASEASYAGYARVAVARSTGMTVSTVQTTSPVANVDFPIATGPTLPSVVAVTYASIGIASSGATSILYSGPVSPTINVSNGVTARLTTASTITES